jgi:hypothetical protein
VTETHSPGANTSDGGSVTVVNGATRPPSITYTPTAQFKVGGVSATESDFESAITAGDTLTYQPDDPSTTGTNEESMSLTNSNPDHSVTGVIRKSTIDTTANTIDVANTANGDIFRNLTYVPPEPADFGAAAQNQARYIVNGTARTLADWEAFLNKIKAASNPQADIQVVGTTIETEFRLTTDQTIP